MKSFKTNCIMCPLGCELSVNIAGKNIVVSGNSCPRGEIYIKNEMENPLRSVSSLVKVGENLVVPVKTSAPVPKSKIEDVLKEISLVKLNGYPEFGTVVIKNILNLGVDIVSIGF